MLGPVTEVMRNDFAPISSAFVPADLPESRGFPAVAEMVPTFAGLPEWIALQQQRSLRKRVNSGTAAAMRVLTFFMILYLWADDVVVVSYLVNDR